MVSDLFSGLFCCFDLCWLVGRLFGVVTVASFVALVCCRRWVVLIVVCWGGVLSDYVGCSVWVFMPLLRCLLFACLWLVGFGAWLWVLHGCCAFDAILVWVCTGLYCGTCVRLLLCWFCGAAGLVNGFIVVVWLLLVLILVVCCCVCCCFVVWFMIRFACVCFAGDWLVVF